ncbi:hypothetical protein GCM10010234_40070 [Streptomyces hawaiiensis]|uniref:hypothetical protein n=1 Tax=Streptomyces hawaiiensis TaxID=67305 RepID=UPI0031D0FAEC
MAPPRADDQDALTPPRRERPSRLIDIAVALLLLVADAVIVVVAAVLLVMVGLSTVHPPNAPSTAPSTDASILTWLVVWGVPAVGAAGTVVHARLRMPVTAVVQGLFTLACTFLAFAWTRTLLS